MKPCSSCRFWVPEPGETRTQIGRCHQQPPQVVVLASQMDAKTGVFRAVSIESMFPTSFANWGCGQNLPKLELVQ